MSLCLSANTPPPPYTHTKVIMYINTNTILFKQPMEVTDSESGTNGSDNQLCKRQRIGE